MAKGKRGGRAVLPARAVAIQVLARVRATDAYLNVVLDERLAEHGLDARDAAFVTELCYGSTRRQLLLDYALTQKSDRRLDRLDDAVLAALRIGAYQLFFLRVPTHAAVGETVEALKALGLGRASGFVNAVLRRLAETKAPLLPPPEPWEEHLSVRYSHPSWLVARWGQRFGRGRAEAMLAADNQPPAVVVRANASKISRDELWAQMHRAGIDARPTSLSPAGIALPPAGRVEDVFGYAEGLWQVQDEAAQLVVFYAQLPAGARVLDACAAPGGKACHLAELGFDVVAADVHPRKLEKIRAEATRLGVAARIRTVAHDVTKPLPAELGTFEAALVDAPCTGLGTLRRHPELRYRRSEADIARLAGLQRQILERVAERVAPGGLLVYAVCSTEPEEGERQAERFLGGHSDFVLEPPQGSFPMENGYLRTFPGPEGLDGFFAARSRRLPIG